MKLPSQFYEPLAAGAPMPVRELPVRPERMIHFFPPHLEKIRARVPEMAKQVDVLLGNLEDAIPADAKEAARAGFIEVAKATDFGDTALWTRVNALNSPWVLDDIREIVEEIGDKLDVMMIPKVEGPWDIHFVDQYLALLEARYQVKKPILIHALLETAQGVKNIEEIAVASPRMHGFSLGPADLAASRGMKTTRVGGGHPFYGVLADPQEGKKERPFFQQDLVALHRRQDGRCLRLERARCVLRAVRRHPRRGGLRGAVPQRLPDGLHRRLVVGAGADRHRQEGVQPGREGGPVRQEDPGGDAGRLGGGDDRRQDAGRRHLEAGEGDRRPRPPGGEEGPRTGAGVRF